MPVDLLGEDQSQSLGLQLPCRVPKHVHSRLHLRFRLLLLLRLAFSHQSEQFLHCELLPLAHSLFGLGGHQKCRVVCVPLHDVHRHSEAITVLDSAFLRGSLEQIAAAPAQRRGLEQRGRKSLLRIEKWEAHHAVGQQTHSDVALLVPVLLVVTWHRHLRNQLPQPVLRHLVLVVVGQGDVFQQLLVQHGQQLLLIRWVAANVVFDFQNHIRVESAPRVWPQRKA